MESQMKGKFRGKLVKTLIISRQLNTAASF